MIVTSKTLLKFNTVKDFFHSEVVFDDSKNYQLFFQGRDALLSYVLNLNLKENDTILVPAFFCNSTILPLIDRGINVDFFDITNSLHPNINEIIEISNEKSLAAIIVVHYFGIVRDLSEISFFCSKNNIKLIEDFSHSYCSMVNVNLFGDVKISSLRKTFPVACGGILYREKIRENSSAYLPKSCFFRDFLFICKNLIIKFLVLFNINIFGKWSNSLRNYLRVIFMKKKDYSKKSHFPTEKYSKLTSQIIENKNLVSSKLEKSQENYQFLLNNIDIAGISFLNESSFDKYSAPQVLPVIYHEAENMEQYLRSKGIEAYIWPGEEAPDIGISDTNFPCTNFYNKNLLLLPCHEDLKIKHLNKIIYEMSQFSLKKNERK